MIAAENIRGGQIIKALLSSQEAQEALNMLAASHYPRAKEAALKVLEFLQKAGVVPVTAPQSVFKAAPVQRSLVLEVQAK